MNNMFGTGSSSKNGFFSKWYAKLGIVLAVVFLFNPLGLKDKLMSLLKIK